jgi:uncharacterized membrane protein
MEMPEIIALACLAGLIVLAVVIWRQQQNYRRLETELSGLRVAFLAFREDSLAGSALARTASATQPEAAIGETALVEARPEPTAEPAKPTTQPVVDAARPAVTLPARTLAEEIRARVVAEKQAADEAAAAQARSRPVPQRRRTDVETALGSRWAVWVGGVALALGAVFLIRYTIEIGIFGPRLRLILAAILGVLLVGGGEFLRRTGFRVPVEGLRNAYVPAILTAAGAFTLFGTVYAAHAVYDFIGPVPAFALLGIIGVVTIVAALLHGQALGGLGLIGSYLTPGLVASTSPNVWTLFGFLAVVLVAAGVIARYRRWPFLMGAAFAGPALWCLFYISSITPQPDFAAVIFIHAVILGTLALVWLHGEGLASAGAGVDWTAVVPAGLTSITAIILNTNSDLIIAGAIPYGDALIVAMLGVAIWRSSALPLMFGAAAAIVLIYLRNAASGTFSFELAGEGVIIDGLPVIPLSSSLWPDVGMAALFVATGLWAARRFASAGGHRAAAWAAAAVIPPLAILFSNWLSFGNLDTDYLRAAIFAALTLSLIVGSEWIGRAENPRYVGGTAVSWVLSGAALSLVIAFTLTFQPGTTSVLMALTGALTALATRWRPYPMLGWLSVASVGLMIARVLLDPTIVGAENLSTRLIFNELLLGYGLPTLAFAFAAWQLKRTTDGTPRHVMEAAAALFTMLTAALLTRHAMNGGVIFADEPMLAEQSIYTLIAIGAAGMMIALDRRSPSPVFQGGSMFLGLASVASIVLIHFLGLNPLYTEEPTGTNPVFNVILLGYLLPAVALGAVALYARGKRPPWYVATLALAAAALAVAYFSLSLRRLFVGENIGLWQGMSQLETYSYSALWLVLGVILLVVGVGLRSQVLRIASAALVVLAVGKVFLFDMAELEGVLRALSFIGLGLVLIGIGLFYQRMLGRAVNHDNAERPA